jgi:hypothetical protein
MLEPTGQPTAGVLGTIDECDPVALRELRSCS